MKIAYITAGAAGMYCGSCLRDNTLAQSLIKAGHDVLLVPTYTPTLTDEPNLSHSEVFLGGINIYLQHKVPLFRHTPRFADKFLDSNRLLNWAAKFGMKTEGSTLGPLTLSMLKGVDGPNRKEFLRLAHWLRDDVKPAIIDLSNGLLIGLARPLREIVGVPVVCTLSGEDIFWDQLPQHHRGESINLIRSHAAHVDAFITFNHYYGKEMSEILLIPAEKLYQVPLGINLEGHGRQSVRSDSDPITIGYFSRICPEKGLHLLAEAFVILRQDRRYENCQLKAAGYLAQREQPYLESIGHALNAAGIGSSFEYLGALDREAKLRFFQGIDLFSVPTIYRESKGIPVIEAWANEVPVVQPWHGAFTELVNETQGGILVPPQDPKELAQAIARLVDNPQLRLELGKRGRHAVEQNHSSERMAEATAAVYQRIKILQDA